jgi:hypothetical protein
MRSKVCLTAIASISALCATVSAAQVPQDRTVCNRIARLCIEQYASIGYATPNECWADQGAENCPNQGGGGDPTNGGVYYYYTGPIKICYGPNCNP